MLEYLLWRIADCWENLVHSTTSDVHYKTRHRHHINMDAPFWKHRNAVIPTGVMKSHWPSISALQPLARTRNKDYVRAIGYFSYSIVQIYLVVPKIGVIYCILWLGCSSWTRSALIYAKMPLWNLTDHFFQSCSRWLERETKTMLWWLGIPHTQ